MIAFSLPLVPTVIAAAIIAMLIGVFVQVIHAEDRGD